MRKPFLTPPSMPEDSVCRTLTIPNSREWLGIFNSALLEMIYAYNYERVNDTDMSIEEVTAYMFEQVQNWFTTECGSGTGGKLFRIGLGGHFEESLDGGEAWQEPTGDAELPPPEARTEPTANERRCLAAANAANTLEAFYEALSDAYNTDIDPTFGLATLVATEGAALAVALGVITSGVGILIFGFFAVLYDAISFISADSWDENFTEKLKCVLYDVSTDTDGIVTFNYNDFMNRLAGQVDLFAPNASELLLFGQIWYLMQFVGTDGLNLAGETTDIEDSDCNACSVWCHYGDLGMSDDGFTVLSYGEWIDGIGWSGVYFNSNSQEVLTIERSFSAREISSLTLRYDKSSGAGANNVTIVQLWLSGIMVWEDTGNPTGLDIERSFAPNVIADQLQFLVNTGTAPGGITFESWTIEGIEGEANPFGDDNCE